MEHVIFIVEVVDPLIEAGVNDGALQPVDGETEAERFTVPVKPLKTVVETVVLAVMPVFTLWLMGVAESENAGAALITSETVVVCVRVPLVPVIVSKKVPAVAEGGTVIVRVEEPAPVTEVGEKVAFTPVGCPLTLKLTAPENPFEGEVKTV